MTTRTQLELEYELMTMAFAAQDAFNELCRIYDDIELVYKRKHREARSWSKFTNNMPPNIELCMCA